jgi:integrase
MGSFPLRACSADAATDRVRIDHRAVHHSATASNRCIAELNNRLRRLRPMTPAAAPKAGRLHEKMQIARAAASKTQLSFANTRSSLRALVGSWPTASITIQLMLGHADIKQTQRYLNITDEELRKAMTGVWERRRQLRAVSQ